MNDPFIPNFTSANRVESETAPALTEPMVAHLSVSRGLELLAVDMDAHPERMLPVEMNLVARIFALVGQVDFDLNSPLLAEDE